MGLAPSLAHHLLSVREHIAAPRQGGEALSIGTIDFWMHGKDVQKLGIGTIKPQDADAVYEVSGREYCARSRRLMAQFFAFFGYDRYAELDINDRADILCDLNVPVPPDLHNRFDLIWDAGSLEHVMNVNQALENVMRMTKVGGKIVHSQGIGDQTNAGYWTFSPNFFPDFYEANGFHTDVFKLVDRRKHAVPYSAVTTKSSFVGSLIPLRFLPGYYLRMLRMDCMQRLSRRCPSLKRVFRFPWLVGDKLAHLGAPMIGRGVKKLQGPWDRLFGWAPTSGYDWGMLFVATKSHAVTAVRYPLQNIYRSTLSEKLAPGEQLPASRPQSARCDRSGGGGILSP